MPKGAPPPAPPPPDSLKALGINQPAPPSKATYADLVEAVRLAYPGQFDDEDPAALAESVLEVYPQFAREVDPATRGMELLPAHEGGPRTSRDFVKGKGGEWLPKPAAPQPVGTPEERAATLNNRKPSFFSGDTLITSGLRVGGSVAGGVAGTAAAAATLNPWAVPAGLFVGGSAGEAAAQLYEREAGISQEISPANIIAQGALNTIPVAKWGKAGVTGAAQLLGANAVKGGAVRNAAAATIGAMRSTGLPARMLSGAVEGAVTSVGGNALETGFEQKRLPTLEESAGAALAGTMFGAAFPAGGALYDKAKVVRAKPLLKAAHTAMDAMDLSAGGLVLPPEGWQAASNPVIAAIEQAAALDPVGGKAAYARLLSVLDGQHQAGLQAKAASFLQGFAEKAESMGDGARLDLAKQFLDRVKDDGLNAQGLDDVIRTLAGIDTNARMSQAAGGMKMLPPAPREGILGAGGRDILPVAPRYAEGPGGPPIEVLPEGEALLGARTDLQGPPALVADQPPGPRKVVTGRLREAAPPPPEPGLPEVDWRGAEGPEQVAARVEGQRFSRIAQQGTAGEVARGLAGVDRARLATAGQPLLPGLPPDPLLNYNFDPRPPASSTPVRKAITAVEQEGVDTLYPVRAGTIDRETALFLRVILADLKEFGYEAAAGPSKLTTKEKAQFRYSGDSAFQENKASPRVAGSKVARTLTLIMGGDPSDPKAPEFKAQIEKFLNGEAITPTARVAAAIKYAGLLKQAWDGEKFTAGQLSPKHLRGAGIVNGRMNDLHLPTLPPSMVLGLDEADDLLAQFAPEVLARKQQMRAEVAADDGVPAYTPRAGEAPEGARQFLADLSDEDLRGLHSELLRQGPDAAQHRGWVADALEQRGIARPEQGILTPESLPMLPEEPSGRLFDLENAASSEVPRGTPDVVEGARTEVPTEVPAEEPYTPPASDLPPGHPDAPPDIPPFDIPEGKLRVRQASDSAWEVTVDGELAAKVTREPNPDAPKPWRMSVVGPDGELVAKSQHATLDEAARRATAAVREPDGTPRRPSFADETGVVGDVAGARAARQEALDARRKALRAQLKPLIAKGGLTKREAVRYRNLSAELEGTYFDQPVSAERLAAHPLPAPVVQAAYDAARTTRPIYDALGEAARGVYHDADTPVDRILKGEDRVTTPQAFYRAFAQVRTALRNAYGDTLTLYRAKTAATHDKPFRNYTFTEENARRYGSDIETREVPVSEVLAVNVGPNANYMEALVAANATGQRVAAGGTEATAFPSLLSDETGAVGTPAQRAASRARSLKALAGSPGARRDFRMSEDTLTQVRKVIAQARDAEEAGLLVGTPDGQIRKVIRSRNTAADPATTFEIDPRTIAATQKRAAAEGLVVLGSWHSQPTGSAHPSKADLQGGVADLPMLIIGASGGEIRDARVWQPRGKSGWTEGNLGIGELTQRPGTNLPVTAKSVQAVIAKIPRFTGAMGDDVALGKYLSAHERELSTEPFFHKAQAALAAGNPRKAWLELQIGQVAYGNLTKAAAENLPQQESAAVGKQIAALEGASAQSPAGQLWALYDGRTVWVEGVGRVVVTPDLPPALKGKGVTAGPGGILRPPAATSELPEAAARESLTLEVVNDVLGDVHAATVLDDPTKTAGTRLFRQVAEQMLLQPARFKAINALGADLSPEQVAAHFTETVSESARILAALSTWKREHGEAIRRIEGIRGASGAVEDLVVRGKGRTVGKLSELYKAETLDALTPGAGKSWDRVILMQALTPGQIGKFDQLGRASRGFMLSQWSTALRNVYSSTGRWGSEASDAILKGLAYTTTGDMAKAKAAYARAGDLLRYAPILRPDGWVMPWKAKASEWEQIFSTSGALLATGKDRQAVLAALKAVPEKAATFLGGTGFGELKRTGTSGSTILDWAASDTVQQTLTMFNRAQEYTIRSAMLHVALNEQLRLRGLDPHTALSLPPDALRARLGDDAYAQVFDRAVGEAMNFTFAGDVIRTGYGRDMINRPQGAGNTAIIDVLNKFVTVREGYPFSKFNLSAAPRYLWDHSGLGLLVEPLYAKVAKRGRYHLGTTGKRFRDVLIPEIDQKVAAANSELGTALLKWQAVKDEITARRRLATQYGKLSVDQANLPGVQDKIQANRAVLNGLEAKSMEAGDAYLAADSTLKKLQAQKATLAETVAQAAAADAPEDFATLFARNMTGAAVMLPLAMMIRADQKDQGVPWYKVKMDEDHTVDLRPFAPFVQYLFVADVLQDFYDNTDWGKVSEDLDLKKYSWDNIGEAFFKGGRYDGAYSADDVAKGMLAMVAAPLQDLVELPGSMYQFYEGKYTAKSLGSELMTVALSTSQLAGTTLSLVEEIANIGQEGLPGAERSVNLVANTIGQMLARFTMPFAQFKGVSALYDGEEAYARIADQGEDMSLAPLGQFLGNLPFIGAATIPETYNQLTGQPLQTQMPLLRSLGGATVGTWDKVSGEITKIGMPGPSVYIRKTGDLYVDKLVGYHYARLVQQYLPQVLESASYQKLDSAALKRDALGKVLPKLKKAAIGFTVQDLGVERLKSAQAGSETRRRQTRVARLETLLQEEGLTDLAPEEPEEVEEPPTPEEPDEPELEPEEPPQ